MSRFDIIRKKIKRKRRKTHIGYIIIILLLSTLFIYKYDNIRTTFLNILHRHEISEKNLNKKIDSYSNYLDSLPFGSPVDTIRVLSDYGWRLDPITGERSYHEGIDLDADYKGNIKATGSGEVIFANYLGNYGFCVIIQHTLGYKSLYAHLYKITLKDSLVSKGDTIGLCGLTGRTTGVHLHYEIIQDEKTINPYEYLKYY